jgi:hypothetical protein
VSPSAQKKRTACLWTLSTSFTVLSKLGEPKGLGDL